MLFRAYRDGSTPFVSGPDRSGGWFPTGDAGSLDPAGRLVVEGRLDEVIVTGGEKAHPTAIEAVLVEHPKVHEVAVWKRPDPEWGERVVAFVVPLDAADPPSIEDLRSWVRERLAPWCAPKDLALLDELPRTASGKVRRIELR